MWTYQTVITTEIAIAMAPSCHSWPTFCWLLLKFIAVCRALGMDRHAFLWFSFTLLAFSIIFAMQMHKRKQKRVRAELKREQERNQRQYEMSMDNLLAAIAMEQNLDHFDSLRNEVLVKPPPLPLPVPTKKSRSLSGIPRKTYKEASTDSNSLKKSVSISQHTQTTVSKRSRIPGPHSTEKVKQLAQPPSVEKGKMSHQLTEMLTRAKKAPVWRN